jgi:phosphoribosylformylglycinamidine cyclo-ligase
MSGNLSYEKAGVNIDVADATKRAMAGSLASNDARVLNTLGAFASLVDARFPGYDHPILVLKTEEPGSKQKLAFAHGRAGSIAYDLINHLIDDIIVMGADPLFVQDCIVCGHLESDVVRELVAALAQACRDQGCTLVGGETSEQPGVLERGTYILSASIVGVVDKAKIIDGSHIAKGDVVIAIASNGLHTNGYSLVRALMAQKPEILERQVAGEPFLDAILRPHKCYYLPLRGLFGSEGLHGLAHITGGGIEGNLNRILPKSLDAAIDRAALRILPLFKPIREMGGVEDADMARTFNLGVGVTAAVAPEAVGAVIDHLQGHGCDAYPIGEIVAGSGTVRFSGDLVW